MDECGHAHDGQAAYEFGEVGSGRPLVVNARATPVLHMV